MTALVLGATGLIGSHLRTELESRGQTVLGTSRSGAEDTLSLDLTNADAVLDLITEIQPRSVVLAAGMSSVAECWQRPADAFQVNTTGTLNLLEALRRQVPEAHLILASSASVYGPPKSPGELPFTEASEIRPNSPYGSSKVAAEILCGQYQRESRLKVTIARIFNQVGPGQSLTQAPSEFAREIALAEKRGDSVARLRVGNTKTERDFTNVRDTTRAIADLVIGGTCGTFNLCSGRGTNLAEVIRMLSDATPLEVSVTRKDEHHRPNDSMRIFGTAEKLETATGWKPEIPLAETFAGLMEDWRRRTG